MEKVEYISYNYQKQRYMKHVRINQGLSTPSNIIWKLCRIRLKTIFEKLFPHDVLCPDLYCRHARDKCRSCSSSLCILIGTFHKFMEGQEKERDG